MHCFAICSNLLCVFILHVSICLSKQKKSLHADNFLYARMNLNAYCQGELLWFKNKYL